MHELKRRILLTANWLHWLWRRRKKISVNTIETRVFTIFILDLDIMHRDSNQFVRIQRRWLTRNFTCFFSFLFFIFLCALEHTTLFYVNYFHKELPNFVFMEANALQISVSVENNLSKCLFFMKTVKWFHQR